MLIEVQFLFPTHCFKQASWSKLRWKQRNPLTEPTVSSGSTNNVQFDAPHLATPSASASKRDTTRESDALQLTRGSQYQRKQDYVLKKSRLSCARSSDEESDEAAKGSDGSCSSASPRNANAHRRTRVGLGLRRCKQHRISYEGPSSDFMFFPETSNKQKDAAAVQSGTNEQPLSDEARASMDASALLKEPVYSLDHPNAVQEEYICECC